MTQISHVLYKNSSFGHMDYNENKNSGSVKYHRKMSRAQLNKFKYFREKEERERYRYSGERYKKLARCVSFGGIRDFILNLPNDTHQIKSDIRGNIKANILENIKDVQDSIKSVQDSITHVKDSIKTSIKDSIQNVKDSIYNVKHNINENIKGGEYQISKKTKIKQN